HVLGDPHELAALLGVEGPVDRTGLQAGEPGFEPGFMVLETMRIALNSLPLGTAMVAVGRVHTSGAGGNVCSHMPRTKAEFDHGKEEIGEGLSDRKVGALTGISQGTIRRWRHLEHPPGRRSHHFTWRLSDEFAYSYLLGCYLGDGTVARPSPNGWELRLSCD